MSSFPDYYHVLGIARGATFTEVNDAYRRLAFRYHPDLHPGDGESLSRFKDVTEAFEVLGDSVKRQYYDDLGRRRDDADAAQDQVAKQAAQQSPSRVSRGATFSDLFGHSTNNAGAGTTGFGGLFNTRKQS